MLSFCRRHSNNYCATNWKTNTLIFFVVKLNGVHKNHNNNNNNEEEGRRKFAGHTMKTTYQQLCVAVVLVGLFYATTAVTRTLRPIVFQQTAKMGTIIRTVPSKSDRAGRPTQRLILREVEPVVLYHINETVPRMGSISTKRFMGADSDQLPFFSFEDDRLPYNKGAPRMVPVLITIAEGQHEDGKQQQQQYIFAAEIGTDTGSGMAGLQGGYNERTNILTYDIRMLKGALRVDFPDLVAMADSATLARLPPEDKPFGETRIYFDGCPMAYANCWGAAYEPRSPQPDDPSVTEFCRSRLGVTKEMLPHCWDDRMGCVPCIDECQPDMCTEIQGRPNTRTEDRIQWLTPDCVS